MFNRLGVLTLFLLSLHFSFGQIAVTNTLTPAELVQNILLGSGITATNIMYNGVAGDANIIQTNASYFDASGTPFAASVPRGVLLSSGAGTVAVGPENDFGAWDDTGTSTVTDPDLTAITPNALFNGVVIEFDFVATGDTLSFDYIFASEEYPDDYGSQFYDVFGFFISGTGFAGPYTNGGVNIATLPGTTTPISILNLNPNTNTVYYVDNQGGAAYGTAIQYDGCSVLLTSSAQLVCGETYHIKLGIANSGDGTLDSGVFLEAESFNSNNIQLETASAVTGSFTDTLLAEGCTTATLNFIRPSEQNIVADTIPLYISGTASLTADIVTIVDTVFFPIGVDTVQIIIDPIDDGITEMMETIEIGYYNITVCGDSLYDSVTLYIVDEYPLTWTMPDTLISNCIVTNTDVEITNFDASLPPYTVSWTFGSTDNPATYPNPPINTPVDHYVTITDGCGDTFRDTLTVITNLPEASLIASNANGCAPLDASFANTSEYATSYEWDFGNGNVQNVSTNAAQSQTYMNSSIVMLVAFDDLMCSDTAYATITTSICGCMDPDADNFNPLATIDDESCVFPIPTVIAPNVFTPNNDGDNDIWQLTHTNAINIEVTIVNRWGNIVHLADGLNPFWDGFVQSGNMADDGTYFYTYKAEGFDGTIVEGHGFMQLISQ
jgi:gliding motility-associated-like protein